MPPRDWRSTRAWRKLRDQVIAQEPWCWLQLPGCTRRSETADHLLTIRDRPDLAMERNNLRGACHPCNHARNDTPLDQLDQLRARLEQRHPRPAALDFFD